MMWQAAPASYECVRKVPKQARTQGEEQVEQRNLARCPLEGQTGWTSARQALGGNFALRGQVEWLAHGK